MGVRHYSGDNQIIDICLTALALAHRLDDKQIKKFMYDNVRNLVFFELDDKNHINYLDFDVKIDKFGDCLEIKANNIVTALWFINEWPYDPDYIMKKKKYLTHTGYYKFDGRTKKLTFHEKTT